MLNVIIQRFKRFPSSKKIIFFGGVLVFLSAFLPWYSDIDRFRVGNTFLGVTGPLYLAGLLVLIAGAVSVGFIVLQLMKKPLPKVPLSESQMYILSGSSVIFMVVLAASVYFHSKFGVNLADKSAGIGMFMAIIGGSILVLGGLFLKKARVSDNLEEEGVVQPLIKIEDREPHRIENRSVEDSPKKEITVGDAVEAHKYRENLGTKSWDHAQESFENYRKSSEESKTDDIR